MTVGGVSRQVNPACVACVTVGLTPQLMGQFGPTTSVVPWIRSGRDFPNPYGTGTANPASTEEGVRLTTTVPGNGGSPISVTAPSLLDTGTWYFSRTEKMKTGSRDAGTIL